MSIVSSKPTITRKELESVLDCLISEKLETGEITRNFESAIAGLIGTKQPVISRLEEADYRGHSLEMLRKIAFALHCKLEVNIVPDTPRQTHKRQAVSA